MPCLRRNQLRQAKVPPANPGRLGGPGGQPLIKRVTSGDTALSPKKAHTEQKHLPTLGLAHVAAGMAMEMDLQQTMPRHVPPRRGVAPHLEARMPPSTRAPRATSLPDHL